MKITGICVGKLKEKFFRDACAEYEKRLGRYCRLEIVEVLDEKTPEGAGAALEEQIREKEASRIVKHIREDAFVWTLEIGGKKMDSPAFARRINALALGGKSHIQFIIGGSLGLSKTVTGLADDAVSFSDMTFPHQLMRVILLEQIYRGFRINANEPYHK